MKNIMNIIAAITLLMAMTSCGLYDTAGQRAQLMGNLHEGMTKREVAAVLGNPEFRRYNNGIEQWEFHKTHFSGAETVILLDFRNDKVISFNTYDGNYPSPGYPPIAVCPPAPAGSNPSLPYPTDDEAWFRKLYQRVKDKPFKDGRLDVIRDAARQSDFTCDEIIQLMKLFSFDDDQLEVLSILEPTIIDRQNVDRIINSMTFISGEEKARNILNRKHYNSRLYADAEINTLYDRVKNAFPSSEQLKTLQTGLNNRNITCKQCVKLLSICNFDSERIKFLQIMVPHLYDYRNQQLIIDTMDFPSGKDEVRQLLMRYCK